jgi:hypothetical protein
MAELSNVITAKSGAAIKWLDAHNTASNKKYFFMDVSND